MQLDHSFTVPVGVEEAWKILLDIDRVGHCMPGAAIDSVDGDNFTGTVKVKLGPINLTYKGHASFVEKDEAARRAVIDARGRDARGNGTAAALVTATLADAGGTTKVDVHTELDITGKPAQFGRGVMVDVGNKLIGQFAEALAGTLGAGDAANGPEGLPAEPGAEAAGTAAAAGSPSGEPAPAATPVVPTDAVTAESASEPAAASVNGHERSQWRRPHAEVEPIDLIKSAGPAVGKRLAPVAVAAVIVLIAVRRRRQRHG